MTSQRASFEAPPIDVLSTSPRLEMLQIRLRQAGLRPVRATIPLDPESHAPLLLDMVTADDDKTIAQFARDWAALGSTRLLVVLGEMPTALAALPVLHLRDIDLIRSLPARLAIRQRERHRREEANLRTQTLKRLGNPPAANRAPATLRMLYLGAGSPEFAALKFALNESGIEIVAALTRHTATDYLSSGQFDGVILRPASSSDEASKLLAHFKPEMTHRATKLFLIESGDYRAEIPPALSEKLADIFEADTPHDVLATRLLDHIKRPEQPTGSAAIPARAFDKTTQLYARSFLEAHLETLFTAYDQTGSPLSMVTFRLAATTPPTLAELILSHLRDNDLAAKLDAQHISVALTATPYRGAVSFARRIAAEFGHNVEWRAVERRQFHTVRTFISATTAKRTLGIQRTA